MCLCCDEISRGGEKRCIQCKEMTEINKMERPYLRKCKKCAAKRMADILKNKKNYLIKNNP